MLRYSFSVKPGEATHQELITKIKDYCFSTGTSFSYLVLVALKESPTIAKLIANGEPHGQK